MFVTTTRSAPRAPVVAGGPLLGSLADLLRDPLAPYLRARRECGDVVRFRLGPPGLGREIHRSCRAGGPVL
ncbi:hypothetical protein [Streptomyces acidicola]|uniref:hypothetical protein n=1 Tax=Streptomyces acidicola TaxID=2596892 RepID=UPI003421B6AA